MANPDRPNGLSFVRTLDGSTCAAANEYTTDSSNGTGIFIGDPVTQEADGNIAPSSTTSSPIGVAVGIVMDFDSPAQRHIPASTAGTVLVIDDPQAVFRIQEDDGGTPLAATSRGACCDLVATAGNATSGISRYEIDQDSIQVTSGVVRLLRLIPEPDNAYGDNASWEVQINEHMLLKATGI